MFWVWQMMATQHSPSPHSSELKFYEEEEQSVASYNVRIVTAIYEPHYTVVSAVLTLVTVSNSDVVNRLSRVALEASCPRIM